jgi:hypothetical protein
VRGVFVCDGRQSPKQGSTLQNTAVACVSEQIKLGRSMTLFEELFGFDLFEPVTEEQVEVYARNNHGALRSWPNDDKEKDAAQAEIKASRVYCS